MKRVMLLLIGLLVLTACGSETTGKRVAAPTPTAAVVAEVETDVAEPPEAPEPAEKQTAAQALDQLKQDPLQTADPKKEGTFYPPVATEASGKDALKEKTKALMSSGQKVEGVEADRTTGSKYYDDDGPTNLPGDYNDDGDK